MLPRWGRTNRRGGPLGQAVLRADVELFRALVENGTDGIALLGADGRVGYVSPSITRILGHDAGSLVGRSVFRVLRREDRGRALVILIECLEHPGTAIRGEVRGRHADGSWRDLELVVVNRLGDAAVGAVVANFRDIAERRRAEEVQARHAAILDGALDAVIGMNARGIVTSWNLQAHAIFGWKAEEAMGRTVADLIIPPGQRHLHERGLGKYLATGEGPVIGRRIETTGLRRDGTEFPIELAVVATGDSAGPSFTAFIADITDRRGAWEVLGKLRRRYELILNSIAEGVHGIDREGRITFENPAAARMLGWNVTELTGRPAHETIHHSVGNGTPLAAADCPIQATLSDGRRRDVTDDVFWRKDGTPLPVEYIVAPMLDNEGQIAGSVVTFRDLRERKEAERRVAESEEVYRSLFENSPQPMWVVDETTLSFLAVNDAAVSHYGWSREEFLALKLTDVRRPEDVPKQLLEEAAHVARRGQPVTFGTAAVRKHRKKDGTIFEVEGALSPITFRGRRAWLGFVSDVTQKRKLEAQVLQSQKMESIGHLAGGVAHDFNNILGVITGSGDLLRRRLPDDPRTHRYVDDIQKAAMRGATLTRQLLAFSRKQVLQPRIVGLNTIVLEMETMLRRLIGEDIHLVTVLDEQLAPVQADPGQLEQVLMNLVVNSRDAMPRGGRITLETGTVCLDEEYAAAHPGVTPGRYSMMAVSDTGHGMPLDVQANIFEPFFTTKARDKGTGLGLATVHGIVKQSGGHIFVYSEPGRGSTFKVYLPAIESTVTTTAASVAEEPAPRGSETVLLVEDEAALLAILKERLEESGYTVLTASNGLAAMEVCEIRQGRIDLLLTDVIMPAMGGSDLAGHLSGRYPDMKVLYMSGYTDDAVVLNGVLSETMPFIEKPFTASGLLRKVREVLDRSVERGATS